MNIRKELNNITGRYVSPDQDLVKFLESLEREGRYDTKTIISIQKLILKILDSTL